MRINLRMTSHNYVSRDGFTLMELLAVVAILAIVVGLILGAVIKSHSKASKLKTKVEQGQKSIEEMQGPGGLLSPE